MLSTYWLLSPLSTELQLRWLNRAQGKKGEMKMLWYGTVIVEIFPVYLQSTSLYSL